MMSANVPVTAPYNFVPLSKHVCLAKKLDPALDGIPSQDHPIEGGLSGRIDLTLTCDTPILVSWSTNDGKTRAFGMIKNENRPRIPGSSLRGMFRNVLEIATFGRMAFVDNVRTGVRDLTALAREDYGSRVTQKRNGAFEPLSKAGWLSVRYGQIVISPCRFARIDHSELSKLSTGFTSRVHDAMQAYRIDKSDASLDMSHAQNVEAQFRKEFDNLDLKLWVQDDIDNHGHKPDKNNSAKTLAYRRAATTKALAEATTDHEPATTRKRSARIEQGTLVFTGMPAETKHMEFFFLREERPSAIKVCDKVWQKFLDVHERQEKVSPTWIWRREVLFSSDPTVPPEERSIPVFYLTDDSGKISQVGLALMFKIASRYSIGEMKNHSSALHGEDEAVDLAARIFGCVRGKKELADWRGRVSFGWASAVDGWDPHDKRPVTVALAKPKPSFVAAYVRQTDFDGTDGRQLLNASEVDRSGKLKGYRAQYRSYMHGNDELPNDSNDDLPKLRGWKRYPVGPQRGIERTESSETTTTDLIPVRPKKGESIKFTASIRYHNMHPIELGAIIWSMLWGGEERYRHSLGLGRPLGWGRLKVTASSLSDDETTALARFVSAMERWAKKNSVPKGWRNSVQIRQLLAMADPEVGERNAAQLKPMRLMVGTGSLGQGSNKDNNPFLKAKEAGQVLPEWGGLDVAELLPEMDREKLKPKPREVFPALKTKIDSINSKIRASRPQVAQHKSSTARASTGLVEGGRAIYAHEIVKILKLSGDNATIYLFDDDETIVVPRSELKPA